MMHADRFFRPKAWRFQHSIQHLALKLALSVGLFVLSACASPPVRDYSAYRQSNPQSILVLPPLNESPDVRGVYSFYSMVTEPLAESGYYVFPVAMVDQTFKDNGVSTSAEMHEVSLPKLREIFGADAVLYIVLTEYGSVYRVLSSEVSVAAKARLVDARTGVELWSGQARASDGSQGGGSNRSALIGALIKQVLSDATDSAHKQARQASHRLLRAQRNGLLYGPRSPKYAQDGASAPQ